MNGAKSQQRQTRLRALSTLTVIAGLLLILQSYWGVTWPHALGLALVVLGCVLRPLERGIDILRRRLDLQAVSSLTNQDLDVLDALLYQGRPALGLTVYEAAVALGYEIERDDVYTSLTALVNAGLVSEESQRRPAIFYYWPSDETVPTLLRGERDRRLRFPKPGSRSRISGLAERVAS